MGQNQPQSPRKPQFQASDVGNRALRALDQAGIERGLGLRVLIIALVSGVIAAILDRVLDLPTGALWFTFGPALIATLNGPTYLFAKGKESIAATVMSAVTGFAALLAWWIITKIIGERGEGMFSYNPADALNLLEVLVCGVVVGLLSYGWFVLLRWLPGKIGR
ncbi:MAG: hypothetical protein M5U29_17565 [Anaerolineae bacterium]|nr:hypothetical protein [Anaerolineae bacterium]